MACPPGSSDFNSTVSSRPTCPCPEMGSPMAASSTYWDPKLNDTYTVFREHSGGYALNETFNIDECDELPQPTSGADPRLNETYTVFGAEMDQEPDNSLDDFLALIQEFQREVYEIREGLQADRQQQQQQQQGQQYAGWDVHSCGAASEPTRVQAPPPRRSACSSPGGGGGYPYPPPPTRTPQDQQYAGWDVHSCGADSEPTGAQTSAPQGTRSAFSSPGAGYAPVPTRTPIPPGFERAPQQCPPPSPGDSSWSSGYVSSEFSSASSSSECPAPGFHPHLGQQYPPQCPPDAKGVSFFVPMGPQGQQEACKPPTQPCPRHPPHAAAECPPVHSYPGPGAIIPPCPKPEACKPPTQPCPVYVLPPCPGPQCPSSESPGPSRPKPRTIQSTPPTAQLAPCPLSSPVEMIYKYYNELEEVAYQEVTNFNNEHQALNDTLDAVASEDKSNEDPQ